VSVAVAAAARPSLLAPLRGRDFRLLWSGGAVSLLGDGLTRIALTWLVLQLTGSPLATGGVLAASAIPSGALGLLGGATADRFGARRIGVLTTLVRAAGMAVLGILTLSHAAQLIEIYLVAIVFGIADAFYGPSRASLLPRCVRPEELEAANGLAGSSNSLLQLIGPAAGGLLVAKAGAGFAFVADAVLMMLVVVLTARLRVGARAFEERAEPSTLLGDVVAGLRYAFSDPVLRVLIVLVTAMTFAISGPESVGYAALARIRWGGPLALGLTLGAFGAGSLAGSLLAGMLPPGRVPRRLVGVGVVLSAGLASIAFAPNLLVAMTVTAGMGVAGGFINVLGSSWLMRRTEPAMMGRIVSLMIVTGVGAAPLSLAAAGALAQVDVTLLFLVASALMLAAALGALTSRTVREAA
jgi:MFS family permease